MLINVLRLNAASCALFGVLFFLAAPVVAMTIGDPPDLLLQILGVGLVVNATFLLWTSAKIPPDRKSVLFFAFGDAIWVVATLALIATGLWITTPVGIVLSAGVAMFVGGCGYFQWKLAPQNSNL